MATEKFTIYKDLRLRVDIEAGDARSAYDEMLHMDDSTFHVVECDYVVERGHETVDPHEYE